MVEIFYKDGRNVPNPNGEGNLSYYIEKKLIPYLEKIKSRINKKDKDHVIIIDGYEGAGKSTFGLQLGKYVDPTLDLSRICMTADEFKQAIIDADKGQCVVYDEAVTGMTAGDSITKIGRLLKSMMMQMRQKNLFVIVIIPTIFELGKYAVLSRAKSFFHVYERGENMGYWVGYNKKDLKKLYLKGKKSYSYLVRSFYNGNFRGKYVVNEEEYRKKKEKALFLIESKDQILSRSAKKWINQRNIAINLLINKGISYREISEWYKEQKSSLSPGAISDIRAKFTENRD